MFRSDLLVQLTLLLLFLLGNFGTFLLPILESVVQFDLASALTKKEGRLIRKAEYMIPYHMARCPNYGWKESAEYARAEELKEKIAAIEAKAKKRWESSYA